MSNQPDDEYVENYQQQGSPNNYPNNSNNRSPTKVAGRKTAVRKQNVVQTEAEKQKAAEKKRIRAERKRKREEEQKKRELEMDNDIPETKEMGEQERKERKEREENERLQRERLEIEKDELYHELKIQEDLVETAKGQYVEIESIFQEVLSKTKKKVLKAEFLKKHREIDLIDNYALDRDEKAEKEEAEKKLEPVADNEPKPSPTPDVDLATGLPVAGDDKPVPRGARNKKAEKKIDINYVTMNYDEKRTYDFYSRRLDIIQGHKDKDHEEAEKQEAAAQLMQEDEEEDVDKIADTYHWQYVLIFPNPDYSGRKADMKSEKACNLYDLFFKPDTRVKNSVRQGKIENFSFSKNIEEMLIEGSNRRVPRNRGESFKYNEEEKKWVYTKDAMKDVQTIVRNVTMHKLDEVLGIKTLSFLSEIGDKIYVLLAGDDDLMKKEALRIKYALQLEEGITDTVSLEPCDSKLRPLLSNKDKDPDIIQMEEGLEEFYRNLYGSDYEIMVQTKIQGEAVVAPIIWSAYREFLTYLTRSQDDYRRNRSRFPELVGAFARGLYKEGIAYAERRTGYKLQNLWNYFETEDSVGAYIEFENEIDGIAPQSIKYH